MTTRVSAMAAGLVLAAAVASAQQPPPVDLVRGELIDPIASPNYPGQSYILYVPTTYEVGRPAPVLYVMDSRGRARIAAELFQPAAERHGWILVSSYNTVSDAEVLPNQLALQAMWDDTHSWFAIAPGRAYLAGISGTTRLATLFAKGRPGTFAGVIGAAAGFHPSARPWPGMDYAFFGSAGNTDFNYWELRKADDRLTALDKPHRVAYFVGDHDWMPVSVAGTAVDWMELQAMRTGLREPDAALVETFWKGDLASATSLERIGNGVEAAHRLDNMRRDYAGLVPPDLIDDVAARSATLYADPETKKQVKQHARDAEHEQHAVDEAMQLIADAFPPGLEKPLVPARSLYTSLNIAGLQRTAGGEDVVKAQVASRTLAEFEYQFSFYLPLEALAVHEYARASYYLGIATQIATEPPIWYLSDTSVWYLLAATEAQQNRIAPAIEALRQAIDRGFRDVARLERDPAFRSLRNTEAFKELVAPLR